jgi:hypothetical protein
LGNPLIEKRTLIIAVGVIVVDGLGSDLVVKQHGWPFGRRESAVPASSAATTTSTKIVKVPGLVLREAFNAQEFCGTVQSYASADDPDFVFAAYNAKEGKAETWQTYKDRADLENAKVNDRLREAVYVWLRNGGIIAATVTTEAGEDWINYADYCFREDGATARVASEPRVSADKMIVRRSWFIDSKGHLAKSKEEFLDLDTEKSKEADCDFADVKTPLYRGLSELLFYSLIQGKGRARSCYRGASDPGRFGTHSHDGRTRPG